MSVFRRGVEVLDRAARDLAMVGVRSLVAEYAKMLELHVLPDVKIRDNLGSRWLGRATWKLRDRVSVVELQRSVLADARTLERVVAHEVAHCAEFAELSDADLALVQIGIKPAEHGSTFRALAARVNAVKGDGFVTSTSDQTYAEASGTREFYLLIAPTRANYSEGTLGFAWAQRPSEKGRQEVRRRIADGGRLIRSADRRWTRGVKIVLYGGLSVPRDTESTVALRRLYESAPEVTA